ncbi:MAG: hypothetical protein DI537_14625 [Stutzerimonas stutzeri]|nr:MAG: hypothetical protein DI537_14625 [Stutzerimonas stutzeri]
MSADDERKELPSGQFFAIYGAGQRKARNRPFSVMVGDMKVTATPADLLPLQEAISAIVRQNEALYAENRQLVALNDKAMEQHGRAIALLRKLGSRLAPEIVPSAKPRVRVKAGSLYEPPAEIWRDVPRTNGIVQVSNYGRFRNSRTSYAMRPRMIDGMLKISYKEITGSGRERPMQVNAAKIVAETFLNRAGRTVLLFRDEDRNNIHVNNLIWAFLGDRRRSCSSIACRGYGYDYERVAA